MLVQLLAPLAPLLVFGLVIFVHELGHFLAAKACGVYAPRFSIGFGPSLFRKRWGETEYVLAALPLGGYVRMASRLDEDMAALEGGNEQAVATNTNAPGFDANAMAPFGPKPIPESRLFESQSLPKRLVILLAGVTMNAVLAFLIALGLKAHYGRTVIDSTVVGDVRPVASAPTLTSLQLGDTVRAVNGVRPSSWNDVIERVLASTAEVRLTTQRGEVRIPVNAPGQPTSEAIANAIDPFVPPVLDQVIPGERAAAAGFLAGDSIVAIDARPVRTWGQFVGVVSHSVEKPLTIEVMRKGGSQMLHVTPKGVKDIDPVTEKPTLIGKIGAAARQTTRREPLPPGELLSSSAQATWYLVTSTVGVVKKLLVREISVSQLSGPVGITRMSVEAARGGFEKLLELIALLSVNVAVLNLLPIPILDGGQVLINVLESAKGKPFSLRTREYILRFGLLAIALLFVVVMYNDTHGWVARAAGWVARLFS